MWLMDKHLHPKKVGATARVVELADTLDLGSSTLGVRVQVPPLALDLHCVTLVKSLTLCESSSVVELHLAKVDVAGSNPVSRFCGATRFRVAFFCCFC
jgi:hypothetical protein